MIKTRKSKAAGWLTPRDVYMGGLPLRTYTNKKNKSSRGDYTKGCIEIGKRKDGGGLHPKALTNRIRKVGGGLLLVQ